MCVDEFVNTAKGAKILDLALKITPRCALSITTSDGLPGRHYRGSRIASAKLSSVGNTFMPSEGPSI